MRTVRLTEAEHRQLLDLLTEVLNRDSYIGSRFLEGRHVREFLRLHDAKHALERTEREKR